MVKNIGAEFFMKKVTHPGMLQEMVEIHGETLDEESLQQFIAKKLEVYQEVIDGRPMLKIWLIPAASGENGTKEIFLFAKFYHFATDGLSITQMFSLMQDGGEEAKYGSNRVRYPVRPAKQCYCTRLGDGGKDEAVKKDATIPKKVLCNERPFDVDNLEHKVQFTKEFKVSQLKQKAKKLGVTLNDVFMGSLVKAIADVSTETGESKVLLCMAQSPKSQSNSLVKDLMKFQPDNCIVALNALHQFKETLDLQIQESNRIS